MTVIYMIKGMTLR